MESNVLKKEKVKRKWRPRISQFIFQVNLLANKEIGEIVKVRLLFYASAQCKSLGRLIQDADAYRAGRVERKRHKREKKEEKFKSSSAHVLWGSSGCRQCSCSGKGVNRINQVDDEIWLRQPNNVSISIFYAPAQQFHRRCPRKRKSLIWKLKALYPFIIITLHGNWFIIIHL